MHRRRTRSLTAAGAALAVAMASVAIAIPSAADDDSAGAGGIAPLSSHGGACIDQPYGGADLFLRGGFNGWGTDPGFQLAFDCNRYEAFIEASGPHEFKVGAADWSAADFGGVWPGATDPQAGVPLTLTGTDNLWYEFSGRHQVTLDVSESTEEPTLTIDNCVSTPALLDGRSLGLIDADGISADGPFAFGCEGYSTTVSAMGSQTFLIGDADAGAEFVFGAPAGAAVGPVEGAPFELATLADGAEPLEFDFSGDYTLHVDVDGDTVTLTIELINLIDPGEWCIDQPYDGRDVYLRGGFNGWGVTPGSRFAYNCNRYEALIEISSSEWGFKVADADWGAVNFGATGSGLLQQGVPRALTHDAGNLDYDWTGRHYFVFDASESTTNPTLTIENCVLTPPLGDGVHLDLIDADAIGVEDPFLFGCDAYYMNVTATGSQSFLIGDARAGDDYVFGAPVGATGGPELNVPFALATAADGAQPLEFDFNGDYSLRVEVDGDGNAFLTISDTPWFNPGLVAPVIDDVAASVRFDSRDEADKAPFGAVTAGTEIDFSLRALAGVDSANLVIETRHLEGSFTVLEYDDTIRIPMTASADGDGHERWSASHAFDDINVYGYYFELSIGDRDYVYGNNANAVYWTAERGTFGVGAIEYAPLDTENVRRYRQTVYDPDFEVPEWAADAVYYYIFPERFRDGNPDNNPVPGVDTFHDGTIEFHDDWMSHPYVPGDGVSDSRWNNDFFGGDLEGIIEKLDYMAELGINTIYTTPIFEAASNHKYDAGNYKKIDPNFGTNEDFERLTAEAAEHGIRVIVDASFNHTGSDSLYFDRYGHHSGGEGAFYNGSRNLDSPWADFFQITGPTSYQYWSDDSLPELTEVQAWRDFAYGDDDSVTDMWLDLGASGWRMDVTPWVSDDFWREWRTAVKANDPDALTVAETWFDSSKYFLGDTYDTTMNYIFRNAVMDFAGGADAAHVYQNIELMREAYPEQSFYALMNLLSTHDAARALHEFGYHDDASAGEIETAKQRLRLAVLFQMTFPGSPAIYYGDEVGLTGGDDPQNRRTYPWADRGGDPDEDLLADFQELTTLRHDNDVLRHGSIDAPIYQDENVIVLLRELDDTVAVTAYNNAASDQAVTVPLPAGSGDVEFTDALTGATVTASGDELSFSVPAVFGSVLLTDVDADGGDNGTGGSDGGSDGGNGNGNGGNNGGDTGSGEGPDGELSDTGATIAWLAVIAALLVLAGVLVWRRVSSSR